MIRPGVAAPIRGIAPLAPTEPVDARALIFNAPEFGAQEVANLRHAMGGDGLSAVRQSFAELRDQADDPNPPQRTLIVAEEGASNGAHDAAKVAEESAVAGQR